MAKVDEFGRPIYETAEEYNKAKKARKIPRTYDSPEGDAYQRNPVKENYSYQKAMQRQAGQTGANKSKKVILVIIVGIIMFNMGLILSMFNVVSDSYDEIYQDFEAGWDDIEDSWDDIEDGVNDGYGEYIGDNTVPLPEGFETFSYNGHTVTLPTSYEEIGSSVYPKAKAELKKHGISCDGKYAVHLEKSDYDKYDLFIGMDDANIRNMLRIFGSDPQNKIKKLVGMIYQLQNSRQFFR